MDCVSSVSYSFVINGGVCGPVLPSRGLRQGDPLSPYLCILVADVFSRMLQNKVRMKQLHGAKASRNGPEISHLLFADDSLLFTRANRQECSVVVDILNQYEKASGQKINNEKSEVSFIKGSAEVPNLELVSDIIDLAKFEWNHEIIENNFDERDARCILSIPLSETDKCDELTWAFSKGGEYSVKTAYLLGKGCDLDMFHHAWVEIWKANVSPKIWHFFWRICTGTLAVRSLLKHRHMIKDAACPWCHSSEETI
ncbi:uncharacterized protein LOC110683928 [Chenopodium quinoa]|uniref:uncharacterized protein LOC110683928 n=1 Tax=Chenopodium quinoa TaxID=63459 RepID=UPI000B7779C7|nr:uncharacterized protein LOC110683928 [Chenopodium quinoa]